MRRWSGATSRHIIIRGISFKTHEIKRSLRDRLVEALSGMGTVPSFTIERTLGVSGAVELVL